MLDAEILLKKNIHIFGIGISAMAIAKLLQKLAVRFTMGDDDCKKRQKAQKMGIEILSVEQWSPDKTDILLLSPGVPLTHPEPHGIVKKAREKDVPIICDIELFIELICRNQPHHKVIAVTGTNGKSTTTALLAHCLRTAGFNAKMLGNIGKAVFSAIGVKDLQKRQGVGQQRVVKKVKEKFFIIEISSYQIDLLSKAMMDGVILLNIDVDHIERHGSFAQYSAVKERLLNKHLKNNAIAVIGNDDRYSRAVFSRFLQKKSAKVFAISADNLTKNLQGVGCLDGQLTFFSNDNDYNNIVAVDELQSLKGWHNRQNAAAVLMMCLALGVKAEQIADGLRSFSALEHRMEFIANLNGVTFVNDSKATNANSAIHALRSYRNIYWIAGGRAKKNGIEPLLGYLNQVKKAYLIGEAVTEFAEALKDRLPFEVSLTLIKALCSAYRDALRHPEEEPVILLSPACASFDQFKNFEKRGNFFKKWVQQKIAQGDNYAHTAQ